MLKKILVTGGAGYIGSNLVEFLSERGCHLTIIDKKLGKEVLHFEKTWRFDAIVHLAAIAGVIECRDDPEEAIRTNVVSSIHIMQLACKYEVPLVFASSGAAPTPYESLYGMTKWIGEVEAHRLNVHGGKNHILRFSNVYGGKYWADKPSVIPLFLNAKKRGEKLIVNGDGSQTRDFIHVNDVCAAIWLALNSERITNTPVPIASGIQTSILEIAKIIGGPNGYEFNPTSNSVGVSEAISDITWAEDIYGFKAVEKIEEHLNN